MFLDLLLIDGNLLGDLSSRTRLNLILYKKFHYKIQERLFGCIKGMYMVGFIVKIIYHIFIHLCIYVAALSNPTYCPVFKVM